MTHATHDCWVGQSNAETAQFEAVQMFETNKCKCIQCFKPCKTIEGPKMLSASCLSSINTSLSSRPHLPCPHHTFGIPSCQDGCQLYSFTTESKNRNTSRNVTRPDKPDNDRSKGGGMLRRSFHCERERETIPSSHDCKPSATESVNRL